MSEFRMFCIAFFASGGLVAAADNHDWFSTVDTPEANIVMIAAFFGTAAVAMFGKRGVQS